MAKKIPASEDAGYKTEDQNRGCQQSQVASRRTWKVCGSRLQPRHRGPLLSGVLTPESLEMPLRQPAGILLWLDHSAFRPQEFHKRRARNAFLRVEHHPIHARK